MKNKDYFVFKMFDELEEGDIFKIYPMIKEEHLSKFFTVVEKTDIITIFSETYGKKFNRYTINNDTFREVLMFPDRKRILNH